MRLVKEVGFANKTVLVRTDYNVPIKNGQIQGDARIRASLAVIRDLLKSEAKRIVIISHLGRPDGVDASLSLKPVGERLAKLLQQEVAFAEDLTQLGKLVKSNKSKRLILVENLRFWPGEADNSADFAQEIIDISGADLFVQGGFGVAHRKTATTDAITDLIPSYASDNFKLEYRTVGGFLDGAERPILAIVGGAKVADKIDFLIKIAETVDHLVIGGAMANSFLAQTGFKIGQSVAETNQSKAIKQIYQTWLKNAKPLENLILPSDVKVATDLQATAIKNKLVGEIASDEMIGDIGKATTRKIADLIKKSKAIIWNGNLGYTENPLFADGSQRVMQAISKYQPQTLIGGGDTVSFVEKITTPRQNNLFLSTGGGASLELLAYGELPGARGLLNLQNQL